MDRRGYLNLLGEFGRRRHYVLPWSYVTVRLRLGGMVPEKIAAGASVVACMTVATSLGLSAN